METSRVPASLFGVPMTTLPAARAAPYMDHAVLEVTVLASQLDEFAEAEGAPRRQQDHRTVPGRHGSDDGLEFIERGGFDLLDAPGVTSTPNVTRVGVDLSIVYGRPENRSQ